MTARKNSLIYYIRNHSIAKPTRKPPALKYFVPQAVREDRDIYTLTRIIRDTHNEGSNVLVAVVSDPRSIQKRGVGKSVFALRLLVDMYKTWKWEDLRRYIVFMPQDFLSLIDNVLQTGKRIPLLVWDDAGFWLNRQKWYNKFVMAVRENLNVIRTAVTSIVFTAPTWNELARGIRDHIDIMVLITRNSNTSSIARGYKVIQGVFEDYKRETIFQDYFNIMLPDEIYQPYEAMRRSYVMVGLERMRKNLKSILEGEDEGPRLPIGELTLGDLREAWDI